MKCCENCFADEYFKKRIRKDGTLGDCDFCSATNLLTIEAGKLYDDFAGVLALYEPTEEGKHYYSAGGGDALHAGEQLPQAIMDDWGIDIFNWDVLDSDKQCELLDEIRTGGSDYDYKDFTSSDELWSSKDSSYFETSEEEFWSSFCDHIKYDRRFILTGTDFDPIIYDPQEWLPDMLPSVEGALDVGSLIYRARVNPIGMENQSIPFRTMGAPPATECTAGRVNPAGIRMLYGALEKQTAVSEVRPEKGAAVSVATMRTKKLVKLADLVSIPTIPSPFGYTEDQLPSLLRESAFLRCVNEALARPVRRGEADVEYIPTQYVAEVIKHARYDGILYKSALADGGRNVVLFDPDVVQIDANVELVRISSVFVNFEPASQESGSV